MDRILEKCTGVCGIADDFVVYGATEVEHDRNLLQFMYVAKQHGLALNSAKCDIKCNKVSFFGQLYTSEGIKPDPQKVKDLREMPVPTTKAELQHLFGFITYLSRFVKEFSAKSAVLLLLSCPSHNFLPLSGACFCPLCHCGQVVIRAGLV